MCILCCSYYCFFFFKQKTAYEMRISDWSSDVCSSDLIGFHQIPDRDTVTIDAPGDRRADLRVLEIEPGALQGGPGANELGLGSEIVVLPLVHGAQRDVAARGQDRKSTRLNSVTNAHLVCRLLLEKKNKQQSYNS